MKKLVLLLTVVVLPPDPAYPVVVRPPDVPICIPGKFDDPVFKFLITTVTLTTPLGMPVKVIDDTPDNVCAVLATMDVLVVLGLNVVALVNTELPPAVIELAAKAPAAATDPSLSNVSEALAASGCCMFSSFSVDIILVSPAKLHHPEMSKY